VLSRSYAGSLFKGRRLRTTAVAVATALASTSIVALTALTAAAATSAPNTPSQVALSSESTFAGTVYTNVSTPKLSAVATDTDAESLTLQFQVLSGTTVVDSATSGSVDSGQTASVNASSLADGSYTLQVRASDTGGTSAWSSALAFTVDTSKPPAPTITCSGYPSDVWTAPVSGGTTCSWSDTSGDVSDYRWSLDGAAPVYTTGTSVSINPGSGLHTLEVDGYSDAGTRGSHGNYTFGVGAAGVTSPVDQGNTSASVTLAASAPSGPASVEFQYRLGDSGAFAVVPTTDVTDNGSAVTWPEPVSTSPVGVSSPSLNWNIGTSVSTDGPVQIEAVFYDSSGSVLETTTPVTENLTHLGMGKDFGTTTVGPISIGLQSGDAQLSSTDASVASYGSALTVTRTYNSLEPTVASIFGPGWTSGLPVSGTSQDWASVTDESSFAVLTAADGSTEVFTTGSTTGGITSYTGDTNAVSETLRLTRSSAGFSLTDASGDVTTFTAATAGTTYTPATVSTPGSTSSAGYVYDQVTSDASYGDPLLALAPDASLSSSTPVATACPYPASASTWTAGCRGLEFSYNTAGDVSQINLVSYDGTTLTNTAVAEYTYNGKAQLKYEWDPRPATPLKNYYTYDSSGRLLSVTPAQKVSSNALAAWNINYDDNSSDATYNKVLTVTHTHSSAFGGATSTYTVDYNVPLTTAAGGPVAMDPATVAGWGQSDDPVSAVAVWQPSHVPSSTPTATDWQYATVDYYDIDGREVNTASYNGTWNVTTTEYDADGGIVRSLTADNRATALAAGSASASVSSQLDTENFYSGDDSELLDTYGPAYTADISGVLETVRVHTHNVYDSGAPNGDIAANGEPYDVVTSTTTSASVGSTIPGSVTANSRTVQYVYNNGSDNEGWTLRAPLTTVTDPGGLAVTTTVAYNENSGLYGGAPLRTDADQPSDTSGGTAGDTHYVYYTAGTNSADSSCGNEAIWTDLLCKSEPAAQPGTTGLPSLPVKQYTYNVNLQPLTETDSYGSTGTRTLTYTYDAAGRQTDLATAVSGSGMGTAVPTTQTVYSVNTGQVTDTETLTSTGAVATDVTQAYDDFGDLLTYTDASGTASSYTYNANGDVTGINDGKGSISVSYGTDEQAVSQTDSQAGTFTGTYDSDGNLVSQTYPDGTVASTTINPAGASTSLVYSNSKWSAPISDNVGYNAQGDIVSQDELNATYGYTYDNDDRLSQVADSQNGQCTVSAYGYDADSDRTSATAYAPFSGGACQSTTASSSDSYTYDAADRLLTTTTGGGTNTYGYNTQGNTSTTPSADAGGTGDLTASYYANGMVAGQTQNGNTDSWTLDGLQNRFATETNSSTGVVTTDHYDSGSDSPSWSLESTGIWSRDVMGLNNQLSAVVTGSGTELQLTDIQGNVIATVDAATDSIDSTTTYTAFGAPESGSASPYGYLGGDQRAGSGMDSQILMGARDYNPYTGRFSQTDPVSGGSANAYDYGSQNPLTHSDSTGDSWLFDFYHWGGHIAFGFTGAQAREMMQGYIWGAAGVIGGLCSWALAGLGAVICLGVTGFITGVLSQAASNWFQYRYREVVFAYGWHWTWYGGYPYFYHSASWTWW